MPASDPTFVLSHFDGTPMTSPARLRIDFVSDVACPWCAIGLASLQAALARLDGTVQADIHLQPFELNPQLPFEGEDANEHLMRKYGIGGDELETNRAAIRERPDDVPADVPTGAGHQCTSHANGPFVVLVSPATCGADGVTGVPPAVAAGGRPSALLGTARRARGPAAGSDRGHPP